MALPNHIVLRPRFIKEEPMGKEQLLMAFGSKVQGPFILKRLDDHIFIKVKPHERTIWSPQLHLEMEDQAENATKIHGVFGPNPTFWTLFMFLHFIIGTLFIACGIWAYVNHSLEKSYGAQLFLMGLMVALWVGLYLFGRMGKHEGRPQMQALYQFMEEILETERKK
ncbi:MAG: GTP-binding protein [Flavobacteriaceae bacterium]